jgi:DNA primase
MIPQATIQSLKKQVDLVRYIESRGTKLTKKGKEYVGLCPFHDDHNPSLSVDPKKQVWHCFGCDSGGDIIMFIRMMDIVSFENAVKKLQTYQDIPYNGDENDRNTVSTKNTAEGPEARGITPDRPVLLREVFDFYHKTFTEDKRGLEYLKSRGLDSAELFKSFKFGFANGSLFKTLNGDLKNQLKEIGILTKSEREFFHDCIVFPLTDNHGTLINLYGRHITKSQHLYLPGEIKGLFYAPKGAQEIMLTEGIIDALTLFKNGFKNALAVYGINGFNGDHMQYLKEQRIKKVILCLDGDDAGKKAAPKIIKSINSIGVETSSIQLPADLDITDYFKDHSKDEFLQLIPNGKAAAKESKSPTIEEIEGGFILHFPSENIYRILGMNLYGLDRLKVNIKLSFGDAFHIDTFDLYSGRSREQFIESAKRLLEIPQELLLNEINVIIDWLELLNGNQEEQKAEMSPEDKEEAFKFLKNPKLLKEIQKDFEACGYIGEEIARLFGYLATISRFLKQPLGILIVSRSAAGKSFLQDAICHFVAPEDLQKYTRITGQSLFYKEQGALKNKVLAIAEEKGAEDAIYSIRTLQSDQYLTVAVTVTDPKSGHKKTEEYRIEGPIVIMITTTNPEALDFETRNRFVILTIDESREQTRKILKKQREEDGLEGLIRQSKEDTIYNKHHNAQRLLRPLQVVNPYFNELTYPDDQLLMRREQKKYLTLIKSIAFLHQYQREIKSIKDADGREIKYIEVTLQDIDIANRLACSVLGKSLDELSPPTRTLLIEIKKMIDDICKREHKQQHEIRFTRRQICEYTGWSYWQVNDHIKHLAQMEYLVVYTGGDKNRCSYELIWDGKGEDGGRFFMGLIDIDKVKQKKIDPRLRGDRALGK